MVKTAVAVAGGKKAAGDPGEILKVQDVAKLLAVSPQTVRNYCLSGQLAYIDLSIKEDSQRPNIRIARDEVSRFLARRARGSQPPTKPTRARGERAKKSYL